MSANGWSTLSFGEFLTGNKRPYTLGPTEDANLVGMRWYGNGPFHREYKEAIKIRKKSHFVIRQGDVIYNKLFAWKGAFGIVPPALDGMFVSDKFPTYQIDESRMHPAFLRWYFRLPCLWDHAQELSTGSAAISKLTLNPPKFLELTIPAPPLKEQQRIAARIDYLAGKIEEVRRTKQQVEQEAAALLHSRFFQIVEGAPRRTMDVVAPLVRRRVTIRPGEEYPELGIRSFGKGAFHKPALDFLSVGSKKLYHIEPGDLVFNNVFAWEGAIAVAQAEDRGRFGSHRFITCVPKAGTVTADFLCFYFLTPEGLEQIGQASPGGAGRNRTLGLNKLAAIEVPVPDFEQQQEFVQLLRKVRTLQFEQEATTNDLDAMLPSILDRAFRGGL